MVLIRTFITTPFYCYFLQMHDCMVTIAAILVNIDALLVQVRIKDQKWYSKKINFISGSVIVFIRHLPQKDG